MNTSILELLQLGGKKNYEFHFKILEEKINLVNLDDENKIISVEIGDPDHEDLVKIIEDVKKQLQ